VGEDEKCGRVRRHGEHDQGPPRIGRLPGVGSVLTVTVADGGDQLAQSRFRTRLLPTRFGPFPGEDVIDHAGASCPPYRLMIIVRAVESAEEALADGRMRCPRRGCGDTLKRWGYGRCRRVRGLGADAIDVRPRRVRCRGCGATQVLPPAALQPRRADCTEVIAAPYWPARLNAWDTGGSPPRWAAHRPPCAAGCVAPATPVILTGSGSAARRS